MSMINFIKKGLKKIFKKSPKKIPVIIDVQETSILNGRTAVITGGSSGIGYAIAEAYLKAGARVIITGRDTVKLEKMKTDLNNDYPNMIYSFKLDNSQISEFNGVFDAIEKIVGCKIDILVNNAGVSCKTSFLRITEEDYDYVMNINLKGMLFLSQEFSNYLIKNNIEGNILNIGSSSGLRPATSPYTVSKWGVRGLTLGMAKQLIKYNIVVNGIAPGPTATPMLTGEKDNLSGPKNEAKRYAHPLEISNMAVQLVSNSCKMIIGDMININGGSGTLTFDDIVY